MMMLVMLVRAHKVTTAVCTMRLRAWTTSFYWGHPPLQLLYRLYNMVLVTCNERTISFEILLTFDKDSIIPDTWYIRICVPGIRMIPST